MTAKEKAFELINKYSPILPYYNQKDNLNKAKQCALIAVDEILNILFQHYKIDYWKEVKREIEKL